MRETLRDRKINEGHSDESSSTSSRRKEGSNELRNRRRAQHNQAVIEDLCHVVADLFLAESKLLKPLQYGVPNQSDPSSSFKREQVVKSVHNFISALPLRYALGADTPSEVLLHMRLMAAVRADKTKAVVHIHKLDDEGIWTRTVPAVNPQNQTMLRLVTICCNDANGLLEYITRLLATGGSRVVDADVMLSTDGIVLVSDGSVSSNSAARFRKSSNVVLQDRFVVEMNGRLRLDRFANLIEAFIKEKLAAAGETEESSGESPVESQSSSNERSTHGPLYYKSTITTPDFSSPMSIQQEMEKAVPLSEVLASTADLMQAPGFPKIRKMHSMPSGSAATTPNLPTVNLPMRRSLPSSDGVSIAYTSSPESRPDLTEVNFIPPTTQSTPPPPSSTRDRRPLVNRKASVDLGDFEDAHLRKEVVVGPLVPSEHETETSSEPEHISVGEGRQIPLIPFDELMLIETLGTGRVSTIYRAAWRRGVFGPASPAGVQMVALKVAMLNNITMDTSHVDELRREADIAARLTHPNVCDLIGVAADQECFCLAYEFCEGGSLLSLLSDHSRYYEYLPIALDVANGMAYLHSRNVIHRDLKPSNILLTRDHRAKISDFGMSVANCGQELTAETGTYRYMAPEVIRHESYSSNADVYSFGICLWQLITREIPFATMTPIQAAYAVAEGRRPTIPPTTPRRLQEIITACWDQDSHRRPSFTYIAMALADYAKMAFSPANVGALTLQIANEMLANVEGNSTVNVDFTTPVAGDSGPSYLFSGGMVSSESNHSNLGLEIE